MSHSLAFNFGLTSVEFSPDGKLLLVGGHDGEIVVNDLENRGARTQLSGVNGNVRQMAFSPDGQTLAAASADGYLALWDVTTWERTALVRAHPRSIYSLTFHSDGNRIIAGGVGLRLGAWSATDLRELGGIPLPAAADVNRLSFLNADTLLAWTGHWLPSLDSRVIVLRAPSFEELGRWEPP